MAIIRRGMAEILPFDKGVIMKYDISFDLETLAVAPDAYILSIAAVPFDIETGDVRVREAKHLKIAPAGQDDRKISADTVRFWLDQERGTFIDTLAPIARYSLPRALVELSEWFVSVGGDRVWGNGANFDIAILEHAFTDCSLRIPWDFRRVRDMRTIVDLCRETGMDPKDGIERGTAHDAQADATFQAHVISRAYRRLIDVEDFEPPTVGNEVV